ncbi:uncharacterized protein LOC130739696 [Lotus japonicus]|uniref:uncharacterized protein LOC130739696 n=1 Tax=Lotus japonicus TaxID=34305 RepID=UPI0025908F4A|nr:uncharacterized protein LOC130739696 [Lotus japonicus]
MKSMFIILEHCLMAPNLIPADIGESLSISLLDKTDFHLVGALELLRILIDKKPPQNRGGMNYRLCGAFNRRYILRRLFQRLDISAAERPPTLVTAALKETPHYTFCGGFPEAPQNAFFL